MTTELPQYYSPKRKREPSESDCYSPSASPTSTISIASLQEARFREELERGRNSPRAAVAGRFGELAIRGERSSDSAVFHRDSQSASSAQSTQARCTSGSDHNLKSMQESLPVVSSDWHKDEDNQSSTERPIQGWLPETSSQTRLSPSKRKSTPPRKQKSPVSPSKNRKQRLSPPLANASLEDPYTWHDHEITGHNATDPNDDGYGINGIGFKPTAAIAWARSQRRQQQVAEWKNREAREAREKRRARRNEDLGLDKVQVPHEGSIQKRVKFDI